MARLYDRMMQWDILPPLSNEEHTFHPAQVGAFTRQWREAVLGSVVIECTNVAEQFIDTYVTDPDPKHSILRDLKCICPPFDKMFFEWSKLPAFFDNSGAQRAGLCVYGTKKDEALDTFRSVFGPGGVYTPKEIERLAANPECHWILMGWDFMQFETRPDSLTPLRGPYNTLLVSVDREGRYLDLYLSPATTAISNLEVHTIAASSMIGYLAMAMMNCKNIVTQDHAPAAPRKPRKRKGRKTTKPRELVTYKTIHVDTSKKGPKPPSRPGTGDAAPKRRGPVRGHMKRYDGAGLFGKYKGTWYWGPHLRGDAKAGVTVADYEIDKPEDDK